MEQVPWNYPNKGGGAGILLHGSLCSWVKSSCLVGSPSLSLGWQDKFHCARKLSEGNAGAGHRPWAGELLRQSRSENTGWPQAAAVTNP